MMNSVWRANVESAANAAVVIGPRSRRLPEAPEATAPNVNCIVVFSNLF